MSTRWARVMWSGAAVTTAAAAAFAVAAEPSPGVRAALIATAQLLAAGAVVARAAREPGDLGRAWALIALGMASYAWTGAFYIAYSDAAAGFPGIADAAIVLYPSVFVALALFWRAGGHRLVPGLVLDASIGGLALAAVGAWIVLAPHAGGESVSLTTYGQVVYATGDMFLLGFLLTATVLARWPAAPGFLAGLALMSAADSAFALRAADGRFAPSTGIELMWALAMLALAAASVSPPRSSGRAPPRYGGVVVAAAAAAIALPIVILWHPGDDITRLVLAMGALVLGGVRLSLSAAENMRLLSSARAAATRQAALAELGREALAGKDVDALMGAGVRLAAEALGADYAAVLESDSRGGVRVRCGYGWPGVPGQPVTGGSPAAMASRPGQPVIVEDWLTETRFPQPGLLRDLGARSGVSVLVPARDGKRRVLGIQCREPRSYEAADAAHLEAVALVLATAIDRLGAGAELRALAAARGRLVVETLRSDERERRRVAEALHDYALQEMLAARQELDDVEADGRPGEYVANARRGVTQAIADLRETVAELHPVVLEHGGFQPALEAVAKRQAARGGFAYEVAIDPDGGDPACGRDEVLVSLAGELLTNVAKHAQASHVTVTVCPTDLGVRLEVEDDGKGIEPGTVEAAPRHGHIGLASWRERVEALGGTMVVTSTRGAGTRVTVGLPPP